MSRLAASALLACLVCGAAADVWAQGVLQVQLRGADALIHGDLPLATFPGLDADEDGHADISEVLTSRRALAAMVRSRVFLIDQQGRQADARLVSVDLPVEVTRARRLQLLMDAGWAAPPTSVTLQFRLFPPGAKRPVTWRVHDGDAVRTGHLDPPDARAVLRRPPKQRRRRPLPEHARPPSAPGSDPTSGIDLEDIALLLIGVLIAGGALLWRRSRS